MTIPQATTEIVRRIRVDRTRTPQQALLATGRKYYDVDNNVDMNIVNAMPMGEGEEVEVVFFKLDLSDRGGMILSDELEKEFELRGLKPADPISLAAVNEADPAFADDHPHGTHWKDEKSGEWCHATFYKWIDDERHVDVKCDVYPWCDDWWLAGIRLSA